MALHAGFDLGRHYRPTPFWRAAHALHASLNPDGPERAFLWNNLVKVDMGRGRPPAELEAMVSALALVPDEIRIAAPNVVVFFTGPRYDARLHETFPGVELQPLEWGIARVRLPTLPANSFRTYHPAYLQRARKWPVIERVATLANEA